MKILNLTQHPGLPEQSVIDLPDGDLRDLKAALTFSEPPSRAEIATRAQAIASIAKAASLSYAEGCIHAVIGGAPYLMGPLERALRAVGIVPLYAFTRRRSVERLRSDGSVKKVTTFTHEGWVTAL